MTRDGSLTAASRQPFSRIGVLPTGRMATHHGEAQPRVGCEPSIRRDHLDPRRLKRVVRRGR
jgi:hypothetical protein